MSGSPDVWEPPLVADRGFEPQLQNVASCPAFLFALRHRGHKLVTELLSSYRRPEDHTGPFVGQLSPEWICTTFASCLRHVGTPERARTIPRPAACWWLGSQWFRRSADSSRGAPLQRPAAAPRHCVNPVESRMVARRQQREQVDTQPKVLWFTADEAVALVAD